MRLARAHLMSMVGARFEHVAGISAVRQFLSCDITAFEREGSGVHIERFNALNQLREYYGGQAYMGNTVRAIEEIGETIRISDEVSTTIASAIEEQASATQEIARNVEQAASGTEEVNQNIVIVNGAANDTESAANEVLSASRELATESTNLQSFVDKFLNDVRVA